MTFTTFKDKEGDRLDPGTVIKDEADQLAIVMGRYAAGTRFVYVICYMDYELREAYCSFGQWKIGDKKCPKAQFDKAYKKALEINDLSMLSSFALHVLNARQLVKPLTAEAMRTLEAGIQYIPNIQPVTVFGEAGFDFITGGQTA